MPCYCREDANGSQVCVLLVRGLCRLLTTVLAVQEHSAAAGVRYANPVQALGQIARLEGMRGLFSGLQDTIVRDAPYSGLYLMIYEQARSVLAARMFDGDQSKFTPLTTFLLAGTCSGVATFLTHPPVGAEKPIAYLRCATNTGCCCCAGCRADPSPAHELC